MMKDAALVAAVCIFTLANPACGRRATRLAGPGDGSKNAAILGSSAAPARDARTHKIQLTDGDEIFAIDPAAVREVDYETPTRTVVAIRPADRGTRFAMVEKNDSGTETARCSWSEPFDRAFGELYSLHIRSEMATGDLARLRTGDTSKLRILSVVEGEPSEWQVVPIDNVHPRLALLVNDTAYELALSPSLVKRLASGCGTK
ncbi:MAG TPA: hypothetical protein VK550_31380 [Polyangiaceae bacterium]|nr:hypothetical protein [Polyangiaceae bacterium]